MRGGRRIAAGVLAAAMTMTVVATPAVAQETTPAGSANTSLFGAEVDVTWPAQDVELTARLLDLRSDATTEGTPFASTTIVPLELNGERIGEAGASSDGDKTTSESASESFSDPLGLLNLTANAVSSSAEADASSAIAEIAGATADLAVGLGGALDLQVEPSEILSQVNAEQALATQQMRVSALGLDLAGLGLAADVLEQLGLDQVLALLDALGHGDVTLEEVETAINEVLAAQQAVEDELDTLDLDALQASIEGALAELTTLDGLLDTLENLTLTDLLSTDLLDQLASVEECADLVLGVADVQDAIDCVSSAITAVAGELDTDLQTLDGIVDTLEGLVGTLASELTSLDGLLDIVLGLLDDLAASPLLGIDAFNVEVTAIAAETVDDSSAEVLCEPVTVAALGQTVATPDCSETTSALDGITSDAVGQVTSLLGGALPINGLDGLQLQLFPGFEETVQEADGVVTATAGLNLLDLQVPALSIDDSAVTDLLAQLDGLAGLGLSDVLAQLQGIVSEVETTLAGLDSTGVDALLGDVTATLTDLANGVDDSDTLAFLIGQVESLVNAILDLNFGTLTDFSTPAVSLVIDPVSTATFGVQAAGGGPGTDPAPDPAPDTGDEKDLPSTGGGAAIAGLVALMGAAGILRRRT